MDKLAEELKEMYAHFGLTAYTAQCFEMEAVTLLMVHARLADKAAPSSDFEELERKLDKKTLGLLLKDVKKRVSFDELAEDMVDKALDGNRSQ